MSGFTRRGEGEITAIVIVGVIVLGLVAFLWPQVYRTPLQVPVGVSVRASLVGISNVVQIKNQSTAALQNVVVTGNNSAHIQTATYKVQRLPPGETLEIGWLESNWTVGPGETITVSADDYLPIVFTSKQLGVE